MRLRVIFPSARAAYPDREVELRMATLRKFCGPQTALEFVYPSRGATFKQNVVYGAAPGYACIGIQTRNAGSLSANLYNNTCYAGSTGMAPLYITSCLGGTLNIQNNAFYGGNFNMGSSCNITWDYNDKYQTSGGNSGSHDLGVNPLFVSPSTMNFYLQSGSPVLNAGNPNIISGVTWMGALGTSGGGTSDTTPPSIPTNLKATAASASQIDLTWSASTDNVGVTGYKIYRNGTQIATTAGTSYSNTGLSAATSYSYSVAAYDAAGNTSGQSTPASATTLASGGGTQPGCLVGSNVWTTNQSFASQSGTFTATFDATPSQLNTDGVMGLSQSAATGYTSLAAIVRFGTSGNIDAVNGGAYTAANTIPYTSGKSYHFRLVVNIANHTYSAYVTPQGSSEQTIGTNYAFRTEQASVSSLAYMNVNDDVGTETVCNFAIQGQQTLDTTSPTFIDFTSLTQSAITSHSPDTGSSWTRVYMTASTDAQVMPAGYLVAGTNANGVGEAYTAQPASTGAEYNVSYRILSVDANNSLDPIGIIARWTDSNDFYYAKIDPPGYNGAVDTLSIWKRVAGVNTELASSPYQVKAGDVIAFQVKNASKSLFVNGVPQISTSDNSLTAIGQRGISLGNLLGIGGTGNLSTGWNIDSFSAN